MTRMRAITGLGALLSVMLALAACASSSVPVVTPIVAQNVSPRAERPAVSRNADGYFDITVEQLAKMGESDDFTLVNVHTPYEGELPDTDLFLAFDAISDHTDQLPPKDAPIVLYCRSGSMSTQAAKRLAELGYTNVYELDGGFNAWQAAGYELLHRE